ncbi:MAG TPA: hypothetical protein VGS03_12925 [Candidatus Polarisedimenticolia bacterium]|nr:hypothetical protein [Candidatus Polarisedimenticolia bacterium]
MSRKLRSSEDARSTSAAGSRTARRPRRACRRAAASVWAVAAAGWSDASSSPY